MDINCNKSNKRTYDRCLKDWMNGLRQSHNMSPYKTIAKFKKQFDVGTAREAYQIADDLYETRQNKYAPFADLDDFRNIISTFGGKTIRVIYVLTNGSKIVDEIYNVPDDEIRFVNFWDSKKWDWKISSWTVFNENEMDGFVFITERLNLTPNHISQSYLDNETQNCIFSPIMSICNKQLNNPELTASTQSKYKTILNKLKKIMPLYKDGVPDNELDEVFKKLKINMSLTLPFCEKKKVHYGELNPKKYIISLNYINTRLDHLEVAGKFYNNNKPTLLSEEEFNNLHLDLVVNDSFFLYQSLNGFVHTIKTINNHYKIINNSFDVFNEFENEYNMNDYCLDDVENELLSQFTRSASHQTCSRINPKYEDELEDHKITFAEIDGIAAYAQFPKCDWYQGFVGNITDFRKTDKIEGIGFYLIGNIDWTRVDNKMKLIQQTFHLYYGRNVYTSPELQYLTDMGAKFKIYGGAWGVRMDFEFSKKMYEKRKIPNYSRWTGLCCRKREYDEYHLNTNQMSYANHIIKNAQCEATYSEGKVTFLLPRDKQQHKAHMSNFIYTYQRINLIEQLMKMDISKVIRINVDGIKHVPHDFTMNEIFKKVENPNINGLLQGQCENSLLNNINNCDPYYWFQFHLHFLKTTLRSHYDNELFDGKGGSGKTHMNLTDKGLINVLYVATSYKLTRAKQLDYNVDTEVLANLLSPVRSKYILKKYNTIIIDEASMVSESVRQFIFNTYKHCKLIFCGDIGYQADPIEGSIMDVTAFQHTTKMTINYRCQDKSLEAILNNLRTAIDSRIHDVYEIIKPIQTISQAELVEKYDINDIILTYTLRKQAEYNQRFCDKEKYVITKSNEDYSRGEIYYEKPDTKHMEKRHGYTTHSVQGETFHRNIYIDKEVISNKKLLYTALSRAKFLNQLHFITDN
tara:strand:- start:187 stop:2937 length:2751 start_codon:yes stop_codon:yes gene_type:complete